MRRDSLTALALAALVAGSCLPGSVGAVPSGPGPTRPVLEEVSTGTGMDRRFVPGSVAVPAGAAIRLVFRNASAESHNLSFTGALEPVRTRTIMDAGELDEVSFSAPPPGTYGFVCTIHEGMTGELRVGGP